MTAYASYPSVLYCTGATTAMTDEPCTEDAANVQVTSTAKRVIDPNYARTWESDPAETARSPVSENLLFGKAVLGGSYDNVTVTGKYLPLLELAWCKAYSIDIKLGEDDNTVFAAATAHQTTKGQILSASGKIDCFDHGAIDYDSGGGTVKLNAMVADGTKFVLAITLGNTGLDFRCCVMLTRRAVQPSAAKNLIGSYDWTMAAQTEAGSATNYGCSDE
jgi:hypothetical protein